VSSVYADASALIKLVVREAESTELERWLVGRSVISSAISRVEVARGVRRSGAGGGERVRRVMERITLVACHDEVLARAEGLGPATLRSLDAIHLASALLVMEELQAFVTYDGRLADAAAATGLAVEAPGTP
jgi:uncharacterized protein